MNAKDPLTALQASYRAPHAARIFSDAVIDQEINNTDLLISKFAAERSTSTIYKMSLTNTAGERIDAFFMPVNLSFGGYGIWHTSREIRGIHNGSKVVSVVRATVWFGSDGFKSKHDIQFTLESRDFLTLVKHALATYAELTGVQLTPRTITRRAA
jgi:hypothetical protein